MSIDVIEFEPDRFDEWNSYVEQSPDTTPFHRAEALQAQARHSGTDLHALVGFKGQEPVGLFALFERNEGPLTAVMSPPTGLKISRLGPALLNQDNLKRRKAENRASRFIDGCFEWIADNCDPHYFHASTTGSYHDPRPFKWNGADLTPEYTYVVDLTPDREEILMQFSSDARRNVRKGDEDDSGHTIEVGDKADVERILAQVRQRFDDQDKFFGMPTSFATDLYESLPDGRVRPYVCTVDGEYVGGVITVEDDERVYGWKGGATPETDTDLAVNDLLDWEVMIDAKERGLSQYDLAGAGERRLSTYKAKFGPTLETFYLVEGGWWPVRALVNLYVRYKR